MYEREINNQSINLVKEIHWIIEIQERISETRANS